MKKGGRVRCHYRRVNGACLINCPAISSQYYIVQLHGCTLTEYREMECTVSCIKICQAASAYVPNVKSFMIHFTNRPSVKITLHMLFG